MTVAREHQVPGFWGSEVEVSSSPDPRNQKICGSGERNLTVVLRGGLLLCQIAHDGQLKHLVLIGLENQ
jgi:hypothetical protein